MVGYFHSIWRLRYFWSSLAAIDIRTRYRGSALGVVWSLLHPLAMTSVLCLVFYSVFGMNIREYGPYLLTGLCFWGFLTSVVSGGCISLTAGEAYIRQYPGPIAVYPLRTTLAASFHFLVTFVVVILVALILYGWPSPLAWMSLIPSLVLIFAIGWSLATVAALSNTYFPDIQHLSDIGLQILFYLTPIMYPAEAMRQRGFGWIVEYNPLAHLIRLLRDPLLKGEIPPMTSFAVASATAVGLAGLAMLLLARLERRIIFQL